jgi:hypothetical protein
MWFSWRVGNRGSTFFCICIIRIVFFCAIMVQRSEIEQYLRSVRKDVHLTPYGNTWGRGSLVTEPETQKDEYEKTALLFDLDRISSAVCQIPTVFKKTKAYGTATSYALKHVLERKTGEYITNGDFIVAMGLSGFRVRWKRDARELAVNPVMNCQVM